MYHQNALKVALWFYFLLDKLYKFIDINVANFQLK